MTKAQRMRLGWPDDDVSPGVSDREKPPQGLVAAFESIDAAFQRRNPGFLFLIIADVSRFAAKAQAAGRHAHNHHRQQQATSTAQSPSRAANALVHDNAPHSE